MKLKRPPIYQISLSSIVERFLVDHDPACTRVRLNCTTSYRIDYGVNHKLIYQAVRSASLDEQIKKLDCIIYFHPNDTDAYYQRAIRQLRKNNLAGCLLDLLSIFLINNHFNLPYYIVEQLITDISPHALFEAIINIRNIEYKIAFLSQCIDSEKLLGKFFSKANEDIHEIKLAIIKLHLLLTRTDSMHDGISHSLILEKALLKRANKYISEGEFAYALKEFGLVLQQNPDCVEANEKSFVLIELIKRQVLHQKLLASSPMPRIIFSSYPIRDSLSLRPKSVPSCTLRPINANTLVITQMCRQLIPRSELLSAMLMSNMLLDDENLHLRSLDQLSSSLITAWLLEDDDSHRSGYYSNPSLLPVNPETTPLEIALEQTKAMFANNANLVDLHYKLGFTYLKYKKYFEAILHMHAAYRACLTNPIIDHSDPLLTITSYLTDQTTLKKNKISSQISLCFTHIGANHFEQLFLNPLRACPNGDLKTGLLKSIINVNSKLHHHYHKIIARELANAAEIMEQLQLILLDADEITMVKHSARMFAQVFREMPLLKKFPDEVGVMIAARTIEYKTISGETSEKIAAGYFGRPTPASNSASQLRDETPQAYYFFRR